MPEKDERRAARRKAADYLAAWKLKNPDKLKAQRIRSREKDRQRGRERHKQNPYKNRERQNRRKARIMSRPYEKIDYEMVYVIHDGRCGLCGLPVSRDDFTVDHIIPIAKGGAHLYANVHLAHPSCNHAKAARFVDVLYSI